MNPLKIPSPKNISKRMMVAMLAVLAISAGITVYSVAQSGFYVNGTASSSTTTITQTVNGTVVAYTQLNVQELYTATVTVTIGSGSTTVTTTETVNCPTTTTLVNGTQISC